MLFTLFATGCWQKSLNPFYTPRDLTFDPELVGSWKYEKDDADEHADVWTFTKSGEMRYKLEIIEGDKDAHHYDAHLCKLGQHRLLDIVARDRSVSSVPAHHLFAVDEIGTSLQLRMLSMEWIAEWLTKHPDALRHIKIADPEYPENRDKDEIILTAETAALQNFLREHLGDEKLFTDPTVLKRYSDGADTKQQK